ncbi:MAG: UDP-N-acetylenolpyruvoylglucosamine reductase, partial [Solobacterium sp.]|nr:UDP-N-acetylenolpyruvoylglucosamine reductase [Solobacterium sp.]
MNSELLERMSEMAEIECDVPLSTMTTLRIGGPARFVAYPDSTVALDALIQMLDEEGIPHKVIG